MFDANSLTQRLDDPSQVKTYLRGRDPYLGGSPKVDDAMLRQLGSTLLGHYTRELSRQEAPRMEMATDENFFDHIHYSDEELAVLAERGQAPLVFNTTAVAVNWVLGSQRRAAMDWKILARRKEGVQHAEAKTELMKQFADANSSAYHQSRAFREAVIAGLGWLETGQGDEIADTPVYDRSESWRNMLWDSTAMEYDLNDARYLFRTKWMDADIAAAMWPSKIGVIEHSISRKLGAGAYGIDSNGDWAMDSLEESHFNDIGGYGGYVGGDTMASRSRVRVIECWFTKPSPAPVMRGGQFSNQVFDEFSPGHWADIKEGRATLIVQPRRIMHCAIMTGSTILDLRVSPYRHNRFPFTPVWGNRRARDGMPYGIVRGLRDINRDLNKRASKALHILSSTRVVTQKGAVDDIEQLRAEAARPDAVIEYDPNFAPPSIETEQNLAAAHMQMLEFDASMIQQVSGVTPENLGQDTNARSGKAIIAKQEQGALTTAHYFENLRLSRKFHGEKALCNVEQFVTANNFEFRITNERGQPEYRTINTSDADCIAMTRADFQVDEADWRATFRQAQAEQLLELFSRLSATAPQLVVKCLDLLIEALDIPRGSEIVKRIRQETGIPDPDADPNNPDPETIARMQAEAKAADQADRMTEAQIAEQEGKAQKIAAEAIRALSEATKAKDGLQADAIQRFRDAIAAAVEIAGAAPVAPIADKILASTQGGGQPAAQPVADQAPAMMPPAPMGVPPQAAPQPFQPQPAM